MTIPGVGPITSLYLVLTLGPVQRFSTAKQVVCYVGLDSVESSSDNLHKKRRYGSISALLHNSNHLADFGLCM